MLTTRGVRRPRLFPLLVVLAGATLWVACDSGTGVGREEGQLPGDCTDQADNDEDGLIDCQEALCLQAYPNRCLGVEVDATSSADTTPTDTATSGDTATSTSDATTTTSDATTTEDTVIDGDMASPFPPAPTLGAQIDRAGRSAVSTALVGRFGDDTAGGDLRDSYNAAGPSGWSDFAPNIAASLAIYDSLNVTCGDQLLADGIDPEDDPQTRYTTLADVLAADSLVVNSEASSCEQYFGAELGVLGLVMDDCGGRTPLHDTIDVTYSALAVGSTVGVGDGVDSDDLTHSVSTFPYLAAPKTTAP